jgi:uncharacterized protein (DUF1810 family)
MDYERFLKAQEPIYAQVLQELRAGNKASHWMWFIFPQLRDLGRSQAARFYGLQNLAEAKLYLKHPILGVRLKECTALVMQHHDKTALEILHHPDDLKFRSCMTLFKLADPQEPLFLAALDMFFRSNPDDMTIQLVKRMPG